MAIRWSLKDRSIMNMTVRWSLNDYNMIIGCWYDYQKMAIIWLQDSPCWWSWVIWLDINKLDIFAVDGQEFDSLSPFLYWNKLAFPKKLKAI